MNGVSCMRSKHRSRQLPSLKSSISSFMVILVDIYYKYHSENFVDFHLETIMVLGDLDLLYRVLPFIEHWNEDIALPMRNMRDWKSLKVGFYLTAYVMIFLDQLRDDLMVRLTFDVVSSQIVCYFVNLLIFFNNFYLFAWFHRSSWLTLKLTF